MPICTVTARPGPARLAPLGVALLISALLASCGGSTTGGRPSAPAPVAAAPLTATLSQDRLDADAHRITASVVNPGAAPVQVGQVQLDAVQYAGVPATPWDVSIPAHGTLDLWFDYGAPRCPASTAAASLLVTLPSPSGVQPARIALDGDALVPRMVQDDCGLLATAAAVQLTFAGPWVHRRVDGLPALIGAFQVDRGTARGAVTVTGYQGSPLYRVAAVPPAVSPQRALADGQDHARLPVMLQVDRCDPHGLTEAKRVFAWRVYVTVDGSAGGGAGAGAQRTGAIEPPAALRTQVHALLADCGTRPVRG